MRSWLGEGVRAQQWLSVCAGRQDMVLATVLLIAIVMMLLPLPTWMVDILITINLMFSVILLLIAIYLSDPLDLSVFPSLLLITTLYRLSLTISTSRLVLLQHNPGNIVDAFGKFVVGGNLTVGLVVFTIITIVQFIVITKGIERVAEVSARFSLDGMPGKQMSIDGDLRAGVIDADHARTLRQHVQQESRFLGAMDGAMKFVKGDTIAGIIVVLVNIIGGIIIAIVQYDMSMSEAVHTYSVLSIGDGLCGQIPSLLISLSAGIIVTRVPGEKRQKPGDRVEFSNCQTTSVAHINRCGFNAPRFNSWLSFYHSRFLFSVVSIANYPHSPQKVCGFRKWRRSTGKR